MQEFADLADGGRKLVPYVKAALAETPPADVVIVAIVPNGVPAAKALAAELNCPVERLVVYRPMAADGSGRVDPVVEIRDGLPESLAGKTVVVVDDAVETGTSTRAVGALLRPWCQTMMLAVPICPRDVSAGLVPLYDEVVAVLRPMVRRALTWHYRVFEPLDEQTAVDMLERAELPPR